MGPDDEDLQLQMDGEEMGEDDEYGYEDEDGMHIQQNLN